MSLSNFARFALFFSIFFVLIYFEGDSFSGIKISLLWKGVVFSILIFLILPFQFYKIPVFILIGYIVSIKHLLTVGWFDYFSETVLLMVNSITVPLVYTYLTTAAKVKHNSAIFYKKVERFLAFFSISIVLSNVPFLMGALESRHATFDFASFGLEGQGLSGIFQGSHAASSTIAVAALYITMFLTLPAVRGKLRFIAVGLFLLAGFALYKTYVRTGYLMFVVGLYFVLFYGGRFSEKLKNLSLALVVVLGMFLAVKSDEAFVMRILDQRKWGQEKGAEENIGSGRFRIWQVHIEDWLASGSVGIVIGNGQPLSKELYARHTGGRPLFSHNGYIEALVSNGIIGFALFISYLYCMWKYISASPNTLYKRLATCMFFMYLIFMLVQGGNPFFIEVILAVSIFLSRWSRLSIGSIWIPVPYSIGCSLGDFQQTGVSSHDRMSSSLSR
ncbi:O-antigen ligase family protein [Methylocaldum sp.]|uniref:O-antigen ligase family protein n=1 Tax=Methylocaldum sp. TaxID=1969727 RepID=UPI002D3DF2E6|nr:O-antigen ligase family protein [Methylocaldum sp.]HYE34677.1 O-antigen ligase family protein [Methylocaldum sp.]